jgi:hypothetical protein
MFSVSSTGVSSTGVHSAVSGVPPTAAVRAMSTVRTLHCAAVGYR